MSPKQRIITTIDTSDKETALILIQELKAHVGLFKIGLEFFVAHGAEGIRYLQEKSGGFQYFLDLKLHDIPNQVAGAIRSAVALKPAMLTVHASGGAEMMKQAAVAAYTESKHLNVQKPLLLAVSVLTSMDSEDLKAVGQDYTLENQVRRLALLAKECGMDGMVCSPREVRLLREACGVGFTLVVPGIRLEEYKAGQDDQKRVMTPFDAVKAGADYLVIGRPIVQAENPSAVTETISKQIEQAWH